MIVLSTLKSTLTIGKLSRAQLYEPWSSGCWAESRSTVENSRSPGVEPATLFSCPCSRNMPPQRGQAWTDVWLISLVSRDVSPRGQFMAGSIKGVGHNLAGERGMGPLPRFTLLPILVIAALPLYVTSLEAPQQPSAASRV